MANIVSYNHYQNYVKARYYTSKWLNQQLLKIYIFEIVEKFNNTLKYIRKSYIL